MSAPLELTDQDGDALTVYRNKEGTWVTCTSQDEEVTVGPFPVELRIKKFKRKR